MSKVVQVYSVEAKKVVTEIDLDYMYYMREEEYEQLKIEAIIANIMQKNEEYDREDAIDMIARLKKKGGLVYSTPEINIIEGNKEEYRDKMRKAVEERLKERLS